MPACHQANYGQYILMYTVCIGLSTKALKLEEIVVVFEILSHHDYSFMTRPIYMYIYIVIFVSIKCAVCNENLL